jgi:hypothetical protein
MGNVEATGALYKTSGIGTMSVGNIGTNAGLGFDASRSNSIYGNADTVQPPAYLVNIWKRTA